MHRTVRALLLLITSLSFERSVIVGGAGCRSDGQSDDQEREHAAAAADAISTTGEDCLHPVAERSDDSAPHAPHPATPDHPCASAQVCLSAVMPAAETLRLAARPREAAVPVPAQTLVAGVRPAPDTPPPRA